jgi:bacterioferritin-associated ferredoxin
MDDCCNRERPACRERFVCRCLQVTETDIFEALSTGLVNDVRDIRRHTGAGDGCTACHHLLKKYVELRSYSSSASPICSVK